MKLFGSIRELVAAVFRKDSYEITVRPNQSTTYTAARDVQLPQQNSDAVLVSRDSQDTLTNKTIDGDDNTLQDVGISSLKTVLGDANKAILRDAAGAVVSAAITNDNISATAAIVDTKLATISTAGKVSGSAVSGNISGNAANVTGTVAIANGGTGQTSQQAAMNALAGSQVANRVLRSDGTNTTLSQVALGTDVSGTLPIGNGGTGQTSANAALNALLPSQAAKGGKYLTTDGSNSSWASITGGAGEINAVLNPSGADGTTGWTAGTSHSLTTLTGTGSPLSPISDSFFSFSSSAAIALGSQTSTSGVYDAITMPTGLRNRKLKVDFYYTTPASSAGTWAVAVYNGATKVALSTDSAGDTILPSGVTGGKFTAYFDTDSASAYSLNFVQRTRTGANDLYITSVIVGPGIQPQGAVVGQWQSFTPSLVNITLGNGTLSGFYRRVGSSIELNMYLSSGSTTTYSTSEWEFSFSAIGVSRLVQNNTIETTAGTAAGKFNDGNLGQIRNGFVVFPSSTDTTKFKIKKVDSAAAYTGEYWSKTTTGVLDSQALPSRISITALFPIAEWAGSGTLTVAQNDVEYAYNTTAWGTSNTTAFGYGPVGTAITGALSTEFAQRVRFQSPIQASDVLTLEFRNSLSDPWLPQSSYFAAVADSIPAYSGIIAVTNPTENTIGASLNRVTGSNTDVDVTFGRYVNRAYNGTSMSTKAWASGPYWRVRKSSAGAAVGFGIVSGSSAGLLPASNSNLDNATATRLGLKQYLHGTTYNGGIAPTVTCGQSGFTVRRAVFVPSQMQDGQWRLRFNIEATFTSATVTGMNLLVNGVVFKIIASNQGAMACSGFWAGVDNPIPRCFAVNRVSFSNEIQVKSSSATGASGVVISGDVELESKPTWAY